MGKIRIKQINAEQENLVKSREKPTAQELKKAQKSREKKQAKKEAGEIKPLVREILQTPKTLKRRHPSKQHGRSARYKKLVKMIEREKSSKKVKGLTLEKAIKLAKDTSTTKFNGSIEAHVNIEKTGFRTTVLLPYSTGRKHSILILTANPKALKSDAFKEFESVALNIQLAGPEEIEAIKNAGSAPEADEVWAMPDIMKEIATIARILGPAGLMPNPKNGTILKDTTAIMAKVQELSKGKITLETERKAPVIHAVLGKADMKEDQLAANLKAILTAIDPKQIKKLTLASTMGPGIKVSLNNN